MSNPKVAQKSPIVMEVDAGVYWWCACGESKNQPFCDGSHKSTEFTPLEVKIEEKKKVAWCACKSTKNQPFCDGTHRTI
ncbi:MAG TPA: CDGSH iron-sulfur domain-containing protein [Bacteroidota bacterium]|jgi:CDGSH-type Zn-finger protein|nr:CDGSH iron-sulfur domain-containing protein [Bacteroidota bacterium]